MSGRTNKLKIKLELLGHTNVKVQWESLGSATEMCGCSGGYVFESDQDSYGLGYSFLEAMRTVENSERVALK